MGERRRLVKCGENISSVGKSGGPNVPDALIFNLVLYGGSGLGHWSWTLVYGNCLE
jgi:hypothetical protein